MKFDLALDSDILAILFMPDHLDSSITKQKTRIKNNNILITKQIYQNLEKNMLMKGEPIASHFKNWWAQLYVSKEKQFNNNLIVLQNIQGCLENEIFIQAALNSPTQNGIVIGNYDYATYNRYKNILFCNKEDFLNVTDQKIKFDYLKEAEQTCGRVKKIFDIFNIPLSITIPQNKSSYTLSNFMSKFYDDEYFVLNDKFFTNPKNQANFDKYILPHIISTKKVEIIIPTGTEGAKNKQKLEQKYSKYGNIDIICKNPDLTHVGYIHTSNYELTFTYRMMIFGTNEKTLEDRLLIHHIRK